MYLQPPDLIPWELDNPAGTVENVICPGWACAGALSVAAALLMALGAAQEVHLPGSDAGGSTTGLSQACRPA